MQRRKYLQKALHNGAQLFQRPLATWGPPTSHALPYLPGQPAQGTTPGSGTGREGSGSFGGKDVRQEGEAGKPEGEAALTAAPSQLGPVTPVPRRPTQPFQAGECPGGHSLRGRQTNASQRSSAPLRVGLSERGAGTS